MNYKHPYNQRMEIENLMDQACAEVKRLKRKRIFWISATLSLMSSLFTFFLIFKEEISANPEYLRDINMLFTNKNTFVFIGYFLIFIVIAIIAIGRIRSINKTIKQLNELF